MSPTLDTAPTPDILFRVGRGPDVWEWRGWESAGLDGTFGHRWDDPQSNYRVLHTSCDRLGAYLEVLAWFRPDLRILAEYANIEDNDPTAAPTNSPGRLTRIWRDGRIFASGVSDRVQGPLVAVGRSASLATIRRALAGVALKHGLQDINAEMIRRTAPRRFTQEVSRFIYEQALPDDSPYGGIFYLSRYGDDVENCAIFERDGEPFPVTHLERIDISIDDRDFLEACRLLGIQPE